jgi:hypothetical protein
MGWRVSVALPAVLALPLVAGAKPPSTEAARARMVARQIRARGITDERVLAAMAKVPRHEFVPAASRPHAYDDEPLPIGHGQTISQPYVVAAMTELARIDARSRVLEVGTGSGYQAAVLAEIAREVYTIEIVEALASEATRTLRRLGYGAVRVRHGDGRRDHRDGGAAGRPARVARAARAGRAARDPGRRGRPGAPGPSPHRRRVRGDAPLPGPLRPDDARIAVDVPAHEHRAPYSTSCRPPRHRHRGSTTSRSGVWAPSSSSRLVPSRVVGG